MPQPSNEWERKYEAAIRQAEETRREYDFYDFMLDLRGYLLLAGLVAGAVVEWGFYWIALGGVLVAAGAYVWWRRSHRTRR